jgi:hypothetical protein
MASNITIARLNTLVTANAVQFTKEMDRAAAVAKTRGAGIHKALSSVGNIAGTLGVGLSVGGVMAFGKSVMDLGGQISDLAAVANMGTQPFQVISALAMDAGLKMDDVARASETMRQRLQDAATNGTDPLNKGLAELNLTAAGLQGLKPEEQWQTIGQRLAAATDRQAAMNTISDLFGSKIGPKLRTTLEELAKGYGNAAEQTKGLTISDDQLRKLDRAGDEWERFWLRVKVAAVDANEKIGESMFGRMQRGLAGLFGINGPNTETGKPDLKSPSALAAADPSIEARMAEASRLVKGDTINELIREKAKKSEVESLLDLFFDEVDEKSKELADGLKRKADEKKEMFARQKSAAADEMFMRNKAFDPNTPTDSYARIGLRTDLRAPLEPSKKEQVDLLRKIHEAIKEGNATKTRSTGPAAWAN